MQIGAVAERVGLSLRTIRYYEEVGLVGPTERSPGGFRLYTDSDVERLRLIKQMKPLEFSLEQMRDLLETLAELHPELISPSAPPTSSSMEPGPEREARLRDRLGMFLAIVDARVQTQREQLHRAEDFSRYLRVAGGGQGPGHGPIPPGTPVDATPAPREWQR